MMVCMFRFVQITLSMFVCLYQVKHVKCTTSFESLYCSVDVCFYVSHLCCIFLILQNVECIHIFT